MTSDFDPKSLKKLYKPQSGGKNGQITIIGGSELFHGAPLLSLVVASRVVDMVFFASPEKSVGHIAQNLKSKLFSFIWVPWDEVDHYIEKSNSCLIGPGFMRYRSETKKDKKGDHLKDSVYDGTRRITRDLLTKHKNTKWVVDAGSLQVLEKEWITKDSILPTNKFEYGRLFGDEEVASVTKKYKCTVVAKGPTTLVGDTNNCIKVTGGNAGLEKGGTGDTLAGLITALYAKNNATLASSCAEHLVKKTAEIMSEEVGTMYNADDLAARIPSVYYSLSK